METLLSHRGTLRTPRGSTARMGATSSGLTQTGEWTDQGIKVTYTVSEHGVKLQLQAVERGVVSIKGITANRYLAMKEDGRLTSLKCITDECFFYERLEANNYNTYRSRKNNSWYVALKRTGQYKNGSTTGPGQKAILFLPMSAKS
ncbi:hypothetical protein XENTR_v10000819 [Xenopus tropicalis]|nr:hypothetical protein XENTR_v10000819 [Xenopus tropicalis]